MKNLDEKLSITVSQGGQGEVCKKPESNICKKPESNVCKKPEVVKPPPKKDDDDDVDLFGSESEVNYL